MSTSSCATSIENTESGNDLGVIWKPSQHEDRPETGLSSRLGDCIPRPKLQHGHDSPSSVNGVNDIISLSVGTEALYCSTSGPDALCKPCEQVPVPVKESALNLFHTPSNMRGSNFGSSNLLIGTQLTSKDHNEKKNKINVQQTPLPRTICCSESNSISGLSSLSSGLSSIRDLDGCSNLLDCMNEESILEKSSKATKNHVQSEDKDHNTPLSGSKCLLPNSGSIRPEPVLDDTESVRFDENDTISSKINPKIKKDETLEEATNRVFKEGEIYTSPQELQADINFLGLIGVSQLHVIHVIIGVQEVVVQENIRNAFIEN
jgi:hypothetical protein